MFLDNTCVDCPRKREGRIDRDPSVRLFSHDRFSKRNKRREMSRGSAPLSLTRSNRFLRQVYVVVTGRKSASLFSFLLHTYLPAFNCIPAGRSPSSQIERELLDGVIWSFDPIARTLNGTLPAKSFDLPLESTGKPIAFSRVPCRRDGHSPSNVALRQLCKSPPLDSTRNSIYPEWSNNRMVPRDVQIS